MWRLTSLLIFMLGTSKNLSAQTMRYFEFKANCTSCPWQDTSFIACTNDQALIDTVLNEIMLPENQRRLLNGPIAYGNGGFNHNGSHWFLWHHIPNQWSLTEIAMEVCDGRPFSDVDANPTVWIDTIGYFCPWTSFPTREVAEPNHLPEKNENTIQLFPNPASNILFITGLSPSSRIEVINSIGQSLYGLNGDSTTVSISVDFLPNGCYWLKITSNFHEQSIKKFVVNHG